MSDHPLQPLFTSRRRAVRLGALAAAGALVVGVASAAPAVAAPAGATPTAASGRGQTFLVVADPAAAALHVFRAKDLRRTGSLTALEVDTHAGSVALPDGRVLIVDKQARVHAVRLDAAGRPKVQRTVAIPHVGREWNGAAWAAVDPSLRYYAVSSAYEDTGDQSVTVVDTRTFRAVNVAVQVDEVDGEFSEVQPTFGGSPLHLVTAAGGRFRSWPLADILAGRAPKPSGEAPLAAGNHGPVVSRSGDRHLSTTPDGVDGVRIRPGGKLTGPTSVPYSSMRDVVQNSRPRWAADDRSIWGAVAENTGLKPEQWADTRNAVHVLDTIIGRSTLTRLPDGINGRLALSRRYAAVTTLGADGDVTTLVDADPRSRMYRRVVGTVALPALAGGPVPGRPTAGTQSRVTAITPDGTTVFVTSGGQGRITAIDTATRRVVRSVTAPTKLSGAYATVVRLGEPVTDLVAR
jgi:YVTN family beta-propeller protein